MSQEIRQEDCPEGKSPYYPGKKSKNNKEGSELSRNEFTDKVIEDWIRHFDNDEKYQNATWSNKTIYLVRYLQPLGVANAVAKEKLMEIERKLAKESGSNELTNSQNLLSQEMDIEAQEDKDLTWDQMSRWAKDQETEKWMDLSDKELFEDGMEIKEEVKKTTRFKNREKTYFLAKSDEELFSRYENISSYTRKTEEFKERHKRFADKYMEDNFAQSSSQDIMLQLSQTPISIQDSDVYKQRLCHLSFAERSERLVMKNIKDTVTELNKTPEGRKQAKVVLAAVSHPVYGDPGLLDPSHNKDIKKQVRQMKKNLLTEKESTLKLPDQPNRQIYSTSIELIARNHWIENTIPEPAKHTGKAIDEGGETIPTRYQDKTDSECYELFKDECKEKVKSELNKKAQELIREISKRPDTVDKQRRMEHAQSLPDGFPSQYWFIKQRPPQTKPLCDHTTGICHLCEAAKMNFSFIVQTAKRNCSCSTKSCPNWYCACPVPEDGEEELPCSCPPCECEVCSTCQVR